MESINPVKEEAATNNDTRGPAAKGGTREAAASNGPEMEASADSKGPEVGAAVDGEEPEMEAAADEEDTEVGQLQSEEPKMGAAADGKEPEMGAEAGKTRRTAADQSSEFAAGDETSASTVGYEMASLQHMMRPASL